MQGGKSPAIEAALVKDLGTIYQQDLPEDRPHDRPNRTPRPRTTWPISSTSPSTPPCMAPSYTIQGGTTQVLRGIVARGLWIVAEQETNDGPR